MKKQSKLKFILKMGLLIGISLMVFFHMYRILLVTDLSITEYFKQLETKDLLLESATMLFSGFFLAFYVRKQMDNLKKAKEGK